MWNRGGASLVRILLAETTRIVTQRIGDRNIVPYVYSTCISWDWYLSGALQHVQGHVPFSALVNILNTSGRSGVDESYVTGDEFPQQLSGTGRQFSEDFPMRGLLWDLAAFPIRQDAQASTNQSPKVGRMSTSSTPLHQVGTFRLRDIHQLSR